MRKRNELLILECTSESREKMSEGWFLWELMRILGYEKKTRLAVTRGRNRFLDELNGINERYLHIVAHGELDGKKGPYIETPRRGRVYASDLGNLWKEKDGSEIPELVVLSACETGHVDMVRAFSNAGCRYCIAPLHKPFWEDAAVFLAIIYKLLIGEGRTPWISYKNTITALSEALPKMPGAWSFYEWGEKFMP